MWGIDPDPTNARILVVPEPRNRSLRFQMLEAFGGQLSEYLTQFNDTVEVVRGRGATVEDECVDAPQLVLPNEATADWLFDVVGRFTRSLPTTGDDPVPAVVPETGKHLSFLGGMHQIPGSCLTLVATSTLTEHFCTGQLSGEDLNLAALLGWIDPGDHASGSIAAAVGELQPPAGPVSDPHWDAGVLESAIAQWHAAETDAHRDQVQAELMDDLREQLIDAWSGCWVAIEHLRRFEPAEHVDARWDLDRRAWTKHSERVATGEARFRNVPTPVQAAVSLARSEDATSELAAQMAMDDPAVMARDIASGEALAGRIIRVDVAHREIVNNRRALRPLLELVPRVPFHKPVGTMTYLATAPTVAAEVVGTSANGVVRLKIVKGALRANTIGLLPSVGMEAVFSQHHLGEYYPRTVPDGIPWTHQLPEES
jgi:hypothetical protein